MKLYSTVAASLFAVALLLDGCSDAQKCAFAKYTHEQFVESGRGGAAEKAQEAKTYASIKAKCIAAGIQM
jgi:hypothetical protein